MKENFADLIDIQCDIDGETKEMVTVEKTQDGGDILTPWSLVEQIINSQEKQIGKWVGYIQKWKKEGKLTN